MLIARPSPSAHHPAQEHAATSTARSIRRHYANCIDGQAATANQRIGDALDGHRSE